MFRSRSTLIYLALVLGLVCFFTFIDKKIPGTGEREEAENQLFKFEQEDVTGLEITNVHGTFVFQKKNDHWEITAPVKTLADTSTIVEILGQVAYAQPQRTIHIDSADKATANNLKEWGLSPAAEQVVVHLKDKSVELQVGRKIAINDSVYARTSSHKNAPVRVIPSTVKTALQKTLSDFRSRNVFDFEGAKVTRVASRIANTATTPGQDCEVDLKDGKWLLQKPLIARASRAEIGRLLVKILALRVSDFITDDASNLAQYGLTSPASTLAVTVGSEDDVLQIGGAVPGKTDQVYAQRLKSNSVFTLTQGAVGDLLKALPNVRDRHILPFDPGKITAVSFDLGGRKADLHRDKGLWNTSGETAGMADIGKITDLLSRLNQLETSPVLKDSAPDLKPFGLDKPAGKITLSSSEFKTPLILSVGKAENHLLYVRNSIEPSVYTVPENAFEFLGDNLSYRDKRVINLQLAKIESMTITPQGKTSLVLNRSLGGTWSPANAKDRMVDSAKAETQASLLAQLQAAAWLGTAQPSYNLDNPVLTIALRADQPNPTILRIGSALPDGTRAAQLEGSGAVFALSDSDYGFLNASSLQLVPDELNGTNPPPSQQNVAPLTTNNVSTVKQPGTDKHKKKK